jgi:hypothetical protein
MCISLSAGNDSVIYVGIIQTCQVYEEFSSGACTLLKRVHLEYYRVSYVMRDHLAPCVYYMYTFIFCDSFQHPLRVLWAS